MKEETKMSAYEEEVYSQLLKNKNQAEYFRDDEYDENVYYKRFEKTVYVTVSILAILSVGIVYIALA